MRTRFGLHINALERLIQGQALHLGHGVETHVLSYGVDHRLAYQSSTRQILKFGDWTIPYCRVYVSV